MRYCDKCGAAITDGGHKSDIGGLFTSTRIICDNCHAAEVASEMAAAKTAAKGIGLFARLIIGIVSGLGMTAGVCALLSKATFLNNISTSAGLIAIEVFAITCFIASKICSRILKSKFLRFVCSVVAYFSFWMSLVFGVAMYFILKYYA